MNTTLPEKSSLLWRLPFRVYHWGLILSFAIAYVTASSDLWQLWHIVAGYVFGALILYRLLAHVFRPGHFLAHKSLGAWINVAILFLGLFTFLTGWASYYDYDGWFAESHETVANMLMAFILIHGIHVLL
jgi:cytochrome b